MAQFVDEAITLEIVAAKDKLVTQANRAETIIDGWEQPTGGVSEAPIDGKPYSRQDATWVEATTSGGGGGSGDMEASVYDPQNINGDAFLRSNMTGEQAVSTVTGLQVELDDLNTAINSKLDDTTVVEITQNSGQDNYFFRLTGQTTGLANLEGATSTKSGVMTRQQVIDLEALVASGSGDVSFADLTGNATDNTSLATALSNKQDKTTVLTNTTASYTTAEETKLAGIEVGAEVNVVDEAPIDTKQYARQDGAWSEVVSSGGGTTTAWVYDPTKVITIDSQANGDVTIYATYFKVSGYTWGSTISNAVSSAVAPPDAQDNFTIVIDPTATGIVRLSGLASLSRGNGVKVVIPFALSNSTIIQIQYTDVGQVQLPAGTKGSFFFESVEATNVVATGEKKYSATGNTFSTSNIGVVETYV